MTKARGYASSSRHGKRGNLLLPIVSAAIVVSVCCYAYWSFNHSRTIANLQDKQSAIDPRQRQGNRRQAVERDNRHAIKLGSKEEAHQPNPLLPNQLAEKSTEKQFSIPVLSPSPPPPSPSPAPVPMPPSPSPPSPNPNPNPNPIPQPTAQAQNLLGSDLGSRSVKPSWQIIAGTQGKRDALLEFHNLCISDQHGLFYFDIAGADMQAVPRINMCASAEFLDCYWTPKAVGQPGLDAAKDNIVIMDNVTMHVAGTVWPYHMTHYFINNGIPMLNVLRTLYGPDLAWKQVRRHVTYLSSAGHGNNMYRAHEGLAFEKVYMEGSWGLNGKTHCYPRAIIGLNSTCDYIGCANKFPDKAVYQEIRYAMWSHWLKPEEYSLVRQREMNSRHHAFHLVIVQRQGSRKILNLEEIKEWLTKMKIGFSVISVENMSFEEQLRIMSLNATALLGVHGNAMGHLFWLPRYSLVIEAFQLQWDSDFFELFLNDMIKGPIQHDYSALKCKEQWCSGGGSGQNADVIVDIRKLDLIFDTWIRRWKTARENYYSPPFKTATCDRQVNWQFEGLCTAWL